MFYLTESIIFFEKVVDFIINFDKICFCISIWQKYRMLEF